MPAATAVAPPPSRPRSTTSTARPRRAASYAIERPITPPPTTTRSRVAVILSDSLVGLERRIWREILRARPEFGGPQDDRARPEFGGPQDDRARPTTVGPQDDGRPGRRRRPRPTRA